MFNKVKLVARFITEDPDIIKDYTITEGKKFEDLPGVQVVVTKGPYKILKVTDQGSFRILAKNTDWDTSLLDPYISSPSLRQTDLPGYLGGPYHVFLAFKQSSDDWAAPKPKIKYKPAFMSTEEYQHIVDVNGRTVKNQQIREMLPPPPLSDDLYILLCYAQFILKRRWPEAEPYIMKDPDAAVLYAADVIEDRWPEAEQYIKQDPGAAQDYSDTFRLNWQIPTVN
jgi:hypothetical protein